MAAVAMEFSDDKRRAKHAAYMREWNARNREKVREMRRKNRADDPERFRAVNRKTYARNSARYVKYQADLRAANREWALDYLGGVCVWCGATQDLEFDHVLPESKSFTISQGLRKMNSRVRLTEELDKCQLLCHDCHMVKTQAERAMVSIISHGTPTGYTYHACRCDLCRVAQREAKRKYREAMSRA